MTTFTLGYQAPNFVLPSSSTGTFNFDVFQEKHKDYWHFIVYFRGAWSPSCLKVLKELESQVPVFMQKKIRIITISSDSLESLIHLRNEQGFTLPILSDQNKTMLKAYGVHLHTAQMPYEDSGIHGEPAYFLIDPEGRILYQHRQTTPYGRPGADDLLDIFTFIQENMK